MKDQDQVTWRFKTSNKVKLAVKKTNSEAKSKIERSLCIFQTAGWVAVKTYYWYSTKTS